MGTPKLVVIDDELEFAKVLDQFFRARGYEVSVALRGATGLQLIDEQKPDVVLIDLKMPGMDGDEVLVQIHRKHPAIKVIIITAYDEGTTRDRVLSLGAFAHFEKPLRSIATLADTVKRALVATDG